MVRSKVAVRARPADVDELAFLPVTELSELVRRRRVTSLELTQMYLARLRKYDPVLRCVISLTEDRAFRQARAADEEIRRGRYRGPLHGIPWGAKDLLAVRGYKTTWGAGPFKEQVIDTGVHLRRAAITVSLDEQLPLGPGLFGRVVIPIRLLRGDGDAFANALDHGVDLRVLGNLVLFFDVLIGFQPQLVFLSLGNKIELFSVRVGNGGAATQDKACH